MKIILWIACVVVLLITCFSQMTSFLLFLKKREQWLKHYLALALAKLLLLIAMISHLVFSYQMDSPPLAVDLFSIIETVITLLLFWLIPHFAKRFLGKEESPSESVLFMLNPLVLLIIYLTGLFLAERLGEEHSLYILCFFVFVLFKVIAYAIPLVYTLKTLGNSKVIPWDDNRKAHYPVLKVMVCSIILGLIAPPLMEWLLQGQTLVIGYISTIILDFLAFGWVLIGNIPLLMNRLIPGGEMDTLINQWKLSQREQEILLGLRQGLSNKELADQRGISPRTVETHLYNIYKKAQVSGRFELIKILSR